MEGLDLEVLSEIFSCRTRDEWEKCLISIVRDFGFDMVLFGIKKSGPESLSSALILTNYPDSWWGRYKSEGFYSVDPVVRHCLVNKSPIVWPNVGASRNVRDSEFYEEAAGYGLRSGISYPIHGPEGRFGILSLVGKDSGKVDNECLHMRAALSLLRDFAYESSLEFLPASMESAAPISLTAREVECLKWIGIGKTSWEVSRILSCSEATVNFHIANLMKKMCVRTRQQAVVHGIKLGLILPN